MADLERHRKTVKRIAAFATACMFVAIAIILFICFCLIEAVALLFVGGAFSLAIPAIATVVCIIGIICIVVNCE